MTVRLKLDEAERLEVICETIRYCKSIRELGGPAHLWRRALREALVIMWELRNGRKEFSAQYRSLASRDLAFGEAKIIYEHAIPMRSVQDELFGLPDVRPEAVRAVLDRMLVACIITAEEDKKMQRVGVGRKMPTDWDGHDKLARYRHAKVTVELNPKFALSKS